jgi:hypothetical protein
MADIIGGVVALITFIFLLPLIYAIMNPFGYDILSQIPNGDYIKLVVDFFPLLVLLLIVMWLFRPRPPQPTFYG